MSKAIIHIKDEVNTVIKNLPVSMYQEFNDMFAVYAKGFRFQAKYKLGVWDGKIRFFNKRGETYVKLLPQIIKHLKRNNYEIELVDERPNHDLSIPEIDKNYLKDKGYDIILGDHQVRGVNALTQHAGGIFEGGTGSGKTAMAAILCHLYEEYLNFKCIIIVPTSDLISQTIEELESFGVDVGEYSGTKKDINHVHIVSTWQSLQNNKGIIGQYQTVIVDECHGVTGKQLQDILNNHGAKCFVKLGLTGTLPEEEIDVMAVKITLGDVVEGVEASELIQSGWLAKLNLYCYELVEDLREEYHEFCENFPDKASELSYTKFKNQYFSDYQQEKKYIQKREERLDFLAKLISQADKNTLVLVPNVEFGRKIAKRIPDSIFFYGQDSKTVRKEIYQSFSEQDNIKAISTYQLVSTGLNVRRIFNLFLVDAGKSYIQVIQTIGRGLRKAYDKDKINVYDVHSDFKFTKKHARARKKHYDKKKYPYKTNKVDYLGLQEGE